MAYLSAGGQRMTRPRAGAGGVPARHGRHCTRRLFKWSLGSSTMLNISGREEFLRRQCGVAAWMTRPDVKMKPWTFVVYNPPTTFSFSLLTPGITGTARSRHTPGGRPPGPSCRRNSRLRRNGCGLLNSHRATQFHWLGFSGRSRWLRIQLA